MMLSTTGIGEEMIKQNDMNEIADEFIPYIQEIMKKLPDKCEVVNITLTKYYVAIASDIGYVLYPYACEEETRYIENGYTSKVQ